MYKVKGAIIGIVCVLLSLCAQQTSYAHGDHGALQGLETAIENDAEQVRMTVTHYNEIKGDMEGLIGNWRASKTKVDSNWKSALTRGSIAIVGAAAVVATSGAAAAYAPAIWLAYLSRRDAVTAGSIDLTQYLSAMGTVQSLMDYALTDIQTAYRNGGILIVPKIDIDGNQVYNDDGTLAHREQDALGYLKTYKGYMKSGEEHTGWTSDDDDETFHDEVQDNNGRVTVGVDSQEHTHHFETQSTYMHYPDPPTSKPLWTWTTEGLPKDHLCGGSCSRSFTTPIGDHGTVCVACRDIYYTCKSNYGSKEDRHKLRECNRKIWLNTPHGKVAIDCPKQYRKCVRSTNAHVRPPQATTGTTLCMENPPDATPYPPQNLSLTPGVTTIQFTWAAPAYSGSSEITDYKYKYRRKTLGPDPWLLSWTSVGKDFSKTITGLAADTEYEVRLVAENSEGYGLSTASSTRTNTDGDTASAPASPSLSPSNASNTAYAGNPYTVQLSILSKAASIEFYVITPNDAINDVSTSLGTASGDGTSTAATMTYTFPSGVSGDYTFYVRIGYTDGTSVSPHPSCTVSVSLPSSTETTTSTETPSSTPEPEPTTTCGGCSKTVSAAGVHSATCASGHSYWTCKPYDVKRHITRTCRFSECGKSWQRCMTGGVTPICDKPWRKQNGLRCWQIY